jgi:acyl carrier protein
MERTETIQKFIEDRFLVEFGEDVRADSNLFQAGVLDSFGYLQLMKFLEKEFSLEITPEDILTNVFVSLEGIDGFVADKIATRDSK